MFFKSSLYNPIQNLTMLSSLFRILWLPFVFCGPFILFTSFNETKIGEINIVIPNLKVMKGKIQIGLYNTKESFPKIGKEYKTFQENMQLHYITMRILMVFAIRISLGYLRNRMVFRTISNHFYLPLLSRKPNSVW